MVSVYRRRLETKWHAEPSFNPANPRVEVVAHVDQLRCQILDCLLMMLDHRGGHVVLANQSKYGDGREYPGGVEFANHCETPRTVDATAAILPAGRAARVSPRPTMRAPARTIPTRS